MVSETYERAVAILTENSSKLKEVGMCVRMCVPLQCMYIQSTSRVIYCTAGVYRSALCNILSHYQLQLPSLVDDVLSPWQ